MPENDHYVTVRGVSHAPSHHPPLRPALDPVIVHVLEVLCATCCANDGVYARPRCQPCHSMTCLGREFTQARRVWITLFDPADAIGLCTAVVAKLASSPVSKVSAAIAHY